MPDSSVDLRLEAIRAELGIMLAHLEGHLGPKWKTRLEIEGSKSLRPSPICQQVSGPGLWGGKGGDKSPPRNEVTGVKGDLFAKYHRGLHALRPKASADYYLFMFLRSSLQKVAPPETFIHFSVLPRILHLSCEREQELCVERRAA